MNDEILARLPEGYEDRTDLYANMTAQEIIEAHHKLMLDFEKTRALYKTMILDITPWLNAAWLEITAEKAAKAPPYLDQGIR